MVQPVWTRGSFGLASLLCLSGCVGDFRLFHPVGPVGSDEFHFTVIATGIMMLIIGPTTVLTCVFAWRYRKAKEGVVRAAPYHPEWSHSLPLELAMWGIPLLITAVLAICTYEGVMLVNPAGPNALASAVCIGPPLEVDVITTDWQWVFVYPQYGIATIDDLVVPAGRTVEMRLTSATVVNDFYIPQVAPMIDVMPGMRTLDAFQVNRPGQYEGFSADFSGAGFSWMQFSTRIVPNADFVAWVAKTTASPEHLSFADFQKIAQPYVNTDAKPSYFSQADPNLFVEVYDAVQKGAVYPSPEEIETKDRYPQGAGKPAVPKATT